MMATTPEKRSTSISYPLGSKIYQTMGDRSQYSNGTSTADMFYRESKEKKLRLQMMERNPSHKF